ncbi:MAG: glyoxylate/hydroxypyruvate reductase A [Pseudomonadota bacterium]
MALLIATGVTNWINDADIKAQLTAMSPGADIRTPDAMGNPDEIRMLAVASLRSDLPQQLPNLELVQKLGAGVETIVAHPALQPHVRVTRLKPDAPAYEIAEYCLAYVLRHQRNMDQHDRDQARANWAPVAPREASKTTVGVLGLGHIGGRTARLFRDLGFQVMGWSRSPHQMDGVTCLTGLDGLTRLLARSDYTIAILPSTDATRDLLDTQTLSGMKHGALLINAGRGDLIVEPDLIDALNTGPLAHAVLDVVRTEPLPPESPLWRHPNVTITPHVSGWHLGDALRDVVENFRRLTGGEPLLHEVDRKRGY